MKVYPTRDKCIFVVCDSIRQEQSGKLSLMGWYPDGIVLAIAPKSRSGDSEMTFPGLALAVAFQDGAGQFRASIRLNAPGGGEIQSPNQETAVEKFEGGAMTINFALGPFKIEEFGNYNVGIRLDDHAYDFNFELRRAG